MKLLLYLFLGCTLLLTACGDEELPTCVDDKLTSFRSEACASTASSTGGNLVRFSFRAETVYCFNWGVCQPDKTIEIWTEDCGLLCELAGPDDLLVCDGTPWADSAVEEEVLFQN